MSISLRVLPRHLPLLALGLALPLVVVARQGAPAPPRADAPVETGIVDFQSKVGSFKIVSPSREVRARGAITMSFKGSVMIADLVGSVTPGPGVRQEYSDPARGRRVFHGEGTIAINGQWRAIQFFGRDIKGRWNGFGLMRLYGEFDENLDTGTYRVDGGKPQPWGNGGMLVTLPARKDPGQGVKPKVEDVKRKPG